ncbi:hypothetical protein GAMM_40044 [Gammaproteobacteria bacterium]
MKKSIELSKKEISSVFGGADNTTDTTSTIGDVVIEVEKAAPDVFNATQNITNATNSTNANVTETEIKDESKSDL